MTFKNLKYIETTESRSCAIVFNFNNKDLMTVKNVFRLVGIKDIIVLSNSNLDTTVKDILDNKLLENSEEKTNSRAIIFNNIESRKASAVSDNLKRLKVQKPLLAVVTETSINWELKTLLQHLQQEAISLSTSRTSIHNNK